MTIFLTVCVTIFIMSIFLFVIEFIKSNKTRNNTKIVSTSSKIVWPKCPEESKKSHVEDMDSILKKFTVLELLEELEKRTSGEEEKPKTMPLSMLLGV